MYTITYLDREGNVFAAQQKYPGETIRLYEETPTHINGHSFAYWMIKETGEYAAAGRKYKKDFDATLIPCYNISYDINFYDSDKETVIYSYGMLGGTRTLPSTSPEKSGYTFLSWNVDGTNKYYLPGETFLLEDDIDFVAVWADNNDACIVYDLGDGEGDFPEQKVDYNVFVTMHSDVPTREGYVFDCWEVVRTVPEDSELVGLKLAPGTVLTNEYSFVVRPIWLKAWVKIKNIPSGNTINLLETNSIQLEAEYFPTENDFSVIPTAMSLNNTASANSITREATSDVDIEWEWSTHDEDIATVDSNGKLTFKKTGMVLVTVKITISIGSYIFELIGRAFKFGYVPAETDNVFEFESGIDISNFDVKEKALKKMKEYYSNNQEIKDVVDGNNSDCNTCIFAFEGLGSGLQGASATTEPNHHEKLGYLKAMMIVTKGRTIKYVTSDATTFPDDRPDIKKNDESVSGKITTLQNGIYKYHTGKHKGYTALVPDYGNGEQNWPAWYLIDSEDDFHSDICESVNLHASGQNPKKEKADANSMGCQTVYISDYFKFGQAVGFLSTSLTETPQTGGITSYLQGKLGYGNEYEQYIKATYILDRTYDEKNNYYSLRKEEYQDNKDTLNDYEKCFNGVFYPINHNDCSSKENYKCTKCPPKES